ncbi:hypothetical protein AVEN_197854-1 [Araneus ventricosus]|uniref:HAT C-terminal dimerisation domain-containing protein n=1 Tax=Araneus ventricosus TaxID=182803 RepID=A0A4Y2XE84_ARAVE|nr:hypothetical protein AVEN_197854-1 [Araneus ventricosus]
MISTANGDRGLCLDKTAASSSSMAQWNFNEEEKIIFAQILYILHAAVNNISFSSFDGISQLFSRMFPKSEEAKGMKLSSRKVAFEISHGLGPYFLAKIKDIDILFRKYPSRKEDLIISSQCVDEEVVCNTLRYVSNRWLSVVPSCQRILKMYPALKQHFLVDLVGNKSDLIKTERYKHIRSALKSHLTPAYIHFLVSIGKIFDNFLRFLQRDKTLIHLLYDEMSNIVRKLLFRFTSMESCQEKKDEDLLEIPLKSIMEKENLKYLDVGHEANKILSSIEAAAKRCFILDAQNFYFSVTSYLLKKLPLKNQLLKSMQVLHPVARKEPVNKTIGMVKRLTKMLSCCVQQEEMDKILDEWRIYVSDEEIKEWSVEKQRDEDVLQWKNIDAYWGNVLCLNDINIGKKRYYHLSKVVKAALCLSHGQAPVERGFSVNKRMMSDRARMAQTIIVGLRLFKDSVKKENVSETVITKEMINFYRDAHSKYKAELLENESKEKKLDNVMKVPECVRKTTQDELHSLKYNVDSAHKLIEEGNKCLEAALKRKSFADVAAAQALITTGNKRLKTS